MNNKKTQEVKELLDSLDAVREQKTKVQKSIEAQKERESKLVESFSPDDSKMYRDLIECRALLEHFPKKLDFLAGEEAKIMDQLKGPVAALENDLKDQMDAIWASLEGKIAERLAGLFISEEEFGKISKGGPRIVSENILGLMTCQGAAESISGRSLIGKKIGPINYRIRTTSWLTFPPERKGRELLDFAKDLAKVSV